MRTLFYFQEYRIVQNKVCCFFGHRKILKTDDLKTRLYETIENLIIKDFTDTFLFGSKSEFDDLCYEVTSELKEKYPNIKRVYVRGEYPEIYDDYEEHLLRFYKETYFPKRALNTGKAVYVERNFEMIENSDICIVYYTDSYSPPRRKNSKKDLFDYQPKSGTEIAYKYAMSKKRIIINIAQPHLSM